MLKCCQRSEGCYGIKCIYRESWDRKSTAMVNEIKDKMKTDPLGDPIILIAPTQSTFQFEQAFVNDSTLNGSLRTEVLHFERLSHRVFQEVGDLRNNDYLKRQLK